LFLVASLVRVALYGRGYSGSLFADAHRSLCSWWILVYLVFLPVPYSLMAEASAIDTAASAAAFSSSFIAYSTVAPATSAASLTLRPKVATMSACMTSCAPAACCSAVALCYTLSPAACCRSTSLFAFCSNYCSSSSSIEGKTPRLVKCSVSNLA